MKFYVLILLSSIAFISNAQKLDPHENLPPCKASTFKKKKIDSLLSTDYSFRTLIDLMTKTKKIHSKNEKYITDRKLLRTFKNRKCDCNGYDVILSDTLNTGEDIRITIKISDFNPNKHTIVYSDAEAKLGVEAIDGQLPLGMEGAMPLKEIAELKIQINNTELEIPPLAYSNIFYPRLCNDDRDFHKKVEAYSSISGKFIYLYFYGGEAASTFFGKLVFDKEKYITKMFAGYRELGRSSSFGKHFIGF